MMRLLITLLCMGVISISQAQYWYIPNISAGSNPGGLNTDPEYPSGGGLAAGWNILVNPSSTPTWSASTTIPFTFSFNGSAVTNLKVSNSGILTFDVNSSIAAPAFTAVDLPSATIPDKSVCISGLGGIASNDYVVTKSFGNSPNRQFWVQFSSYGYGTTQSDGTNYCYWSIVLEETTNKIYIVDNRSYGFTSPVVSAGIQINNTTAYKVAGSPTLAPKAGADATPADNTYYEFIPGTQPALDLTATGTSVPDYIAIVNGNVTINAVLKNIGSTAITNFKLNYSVDGGATVTSTVINTSIAKFATASVNHTTTWNPAPVGPKNIKIWASDLNGSADENLTNDAITKQVTVVDNFTPRLILNEIFSSSTCGPCNPGNVNFRNVVSAKDPAKFTYIKYQMNYPGTGDPYYTAECNTRHSFYGINSIPRMEVDGGWNSNAGSFTSALFDQFQSKPSFIKITGTSVTKWHTVNMAINLEPLADITSTNLRVFAAILEDSTVKNIKTNGETVFHHGLKKMVPDASGSAVPSGNFVKGTSKTLNLSFTFPGPNVLPANGTVPINLATQNNIENFASLLTLVWVQDIVTKEVYQSGYLAHSTASTDELKVKGSFNVSPNPTSSSFNVEFVADKTVKVDILDITGKVVYSVPSNVIVNGKNNLMFNANNYAKGTYLVKITGADFTATKKLVIN